MTWFCAITYRGKTRITAHPTPQMARNRMIAFVAPKVHHGRLPEVTFSQIESDSALAWNQSEPGSSLTLRIAEDE